MLGAGWSENPKTGNECVIVQMILKHEIEIALLGTSYPPRRYGTASRLNEGMLS